MNSCITRPNHHNTGSVHIQTHQSGQALSAHYAKSPEEDAHEAAQTLGHKVWVCVREGNVSCHCKPASLTHVAVRHMQFLCCSQAGDPCIQSKLHEDLTHEDPGTLHVLWVVQKA